MRKNFFVAMVSVAMVGSLALTGYAVKLVEPGKAFEAATTTKEKSPANLVPGSGRIEPRSEEIKISSQVSGKLKSVLVEEGDLIEKGQVLAELENADFVALVASAQARLKIREAELLKLKNGSRTEERREAQANVREAEAQVANAKLEYERKQKLLAEGFIARHDVDTLDRNYQVAQARLEALRERMNLIETQTRDEDLARAEAEVQLAQAEVQEAQARLAKTIIRSPISGIVLRKHLHIGESVSDTNPNPIVTISDRLAQRVRVDIDESDVAKVKLGQKAYVTADAFGEKQFYGKVVQVGQILGKKNIRTEEPTERVDTKILEVLIELEPDTRLPLGLRVNAFLIAEHQ